MSRHIRDPIHSFVELDTRESQLLDMPALQRLRRVRQLALARLVYPGAVHTRFEHTLGVLEVSRRLCAALEIEEHDARIIRFAALLHDVGHGPFSHVSESVLDSLAPSDLGSEAGHREKIHEVITRKIILEHPAFSEVLSTKDREDIAGLLSHGYGYRVHQDIVSGPLDADKQDYLLRDSYFCGVRYGLFDLDQLHQTFTKAADGRDIALMVSADGVHAVEQFILAKYYLSQQVYRHRVRLITDQMLIRAIELGVRVDGLDWLGRLYRYEDSDAFVENYLSWDDDRLTAELLRPDHEGTRAGQWFRRLTERRLLKRVFTRKLSELVQPEKALEAYAWKKHRSDIENEIAEAVSEVVGSPLPGEQVILNTFSVESVRASVAAKEGPILVLTGRQPVQFDDESLLFASVDKALKEEFVECYAPLQYEDDRQKVDFLERIDERIVTVLTRSIGAENTETQEGDKLC